MVCGFHLSKSLSNCLLLCAWTTVLIAALLPCMGSGSCIRENKNQCCKGANASCFGFEENLRSRGSFKKCYCDEGCQATNDCCRSYDKDCLRGDIDCKVSRWSMWSVCSKDCGLGKSQRTRHVTVAAQNGGAPCPPLQEERVCRGTNCSWGWSQRGGNAMMSRRLREVAYLIPAKGDIAGVIRQYSPMHDIRSNLFRHRSNGTTQPKLTAYCAYYEIVSARKHCETWWNLGSQLATWWDHLQNLKPGRRICVTCLPNYMKSGLDWRCQGTGVFQKSSQWRATQIRYCTGYFRMVGQPQACVCRPNHANSFVFI